MTPEVGLRRSYYAAVLRRTAEIDGVIAAMWGVSGTALGYCGHAWLMTAPVIEQLPLAFFRETRREVATMLAAHRRIEGECAVEYVAAQRFLALVGFTFGDTVDMPGGKFRKFYMEGV